MAEKVFLKPREGVKVRMPLPGVGHLPEEGAPVEKTIYWRRRINDGDVLVASAPKKPAEPPAPKAE